FRGLLRTVRTGDRRTRAAARELIENLLTGPARELTLALVDELSDADRQARLGAGTSPAQPTYRKLLAGICADEAGGTLAAPAARSPSPYEARAAEPVHCLDVDAELLTELLEDDFELFLRTLRPGAAAVMRRWQSDPRPAIALPPEDGSPPLGPAERLLSLRD